MPTTAQEGGDFSHGAHDRLQMGTDCLGRTIYAGEIFDPSTTRQPGGACGTTWVRDPFTNNKYRHGWVRDG